MTAVPPGRYVRRATVAAQKASASRGGNVAKTAAGKFSAMKALIAAAMATAYNGIQERFRTADGRAPARLRLPAGFGLRGRSVRYPPRGWDQTPEQVARAKELAAQKREARAARNLMLAGKA
jgi:hypothetical protein